MNRLMVVLGLIVAVGAASALIIPSAAGIVNLGNVFNGRTDKKIRALRQDMKMVNYYLPLIGRKLGIPPPPLSGGNSSGDENGKDGE